MADEGGAFLRVEVLGTVQLSRALSRFGATIEDWRPLWRDLGAELRAIEETAFATEGATVEGGGWEPLSPAYAQWKATHHPGRPILELTGALKESLTRLGGDHIERYNRRSMVFDTRDPKALWHQLGTSKMPARSPVGLSEADKRRITRNALRWVVSMERGAGLV